MSHRIAARLVTAVLCGALFLPVLFTIEVLSAGESGSDGRAPAEGSANELIFPVKLVCSLKTPVRMPFHGVIKTISAQCGRPVKAGESLAAYRLTLEARANLRQRMFSHEVRELEVRLAEVERAAVEMKGVRDRLEASRRRDATTSQSVARMDEQIRALERQQEAIRNRLWLERVFVQDTLMLLSKQLGKPISPEQPLEEALLMAPMDGHVLWMHPDLREGMELQASLVVSQVGVMDPMLARAEVFETEVMKIDVGMRAEVELESLPGRVFESRVSRVSMIPSDSRPGQPSYYELELTLPNPDFLLREGLTGRARIH